ncbi:MAG: FtsQ-type POTRA domain-containing protein [Deinococcota bacterium]|nr:FtsQ-type POTRA domain-containing protein [Deinococcota bacterium]
MRRALLLAGLGLALAAVALSLYHPRIASVVVSGNAHYSAEEVMALAEVRLADPLLWVHRWRARRLALDPWILRARLVRHWPDTVLIHVWERRPAIRIGDRILALDGTVLGDASTADPRASQTADLVLVRGWGEDRSDEAIALVQLLEEYEPKMLSYSPGGFDIELEDGRLFTPDIAALRAHWSGFTSQQGKSVYVYPWGVSVQQ